MPEARTQTPTMSVIVPLYNTERYIAEALDSLLAQSFANFEVVVVNDASQDSGPEIVERYIARDPRVRMVTQENRGLAGARNTGIREARGRYLVLLDADDSFEPEKLQRHFDHLEANPDVGVSYAPSLFMDEDSQLMGLVQTPKLKNVDAEHVFCRNPVGNGSAAVLRADAMADVAFDVDAPEGTRRCWFDESFRQSEDIEMWSRIAATTEWRFEGIAEPLTRHRVNNSGLSANTEKQFETWQRFRDKLKALAPDLVARAGNRAEAYQLRYLARRAAISGDGVKSLGLIAKSVRRHPAIIAEEPKRTLVTFGFATVASVLPAGAFETLKSALFSPRRATA
jgi:glycosyltransferase involved in cell wall biosynthesis